MSERTVPSISHIALSLGDVWTKKEGEFKTNEVKYISRLVCCKQES